MTTPTAPGDDRWTEGSLESGADPEEASDTSSAQPVGAEIGLQEGQATTFEPEEEQS
jgi:hypothetical protein